MSAHTDVASAQSPLGRPWWVDETSRVREEAAFVGPRGARILAFLHRPYRQDCVGAVVMCNSLYEDLQVHYRRDVLLARELARRGVAVVRFHYRGTGDSDPVMGDAVELETLLADGRAAISWLRERTGVTRPIMFGARFGAIVAAELAAGGEAGGMALVSPMLSGADYFRGMSRAGKVAGMRTEDRGAVESLDEQLRTREFADVLGNTIWRRSYLDLARRRLRVEELAHVPVLLVQVAPSDTLSNQYQSFVDQLARADAPVETLLVRQRERWFVPDQWEPEEQVPETQAFTAGIAGWIVTRCADGRP